MKITAHFKNAFVSIILLFPSILIAQTGLILKEKLDVDAEKMDIIFQNQNLFNQPVYFLNKTTSKVLVGDYGTAKIERRSPSQSSTKMIGISATEVKFKFTIDFTNSSNESTELIGTKSNISNNLKTTKATISTNLENSKPWDFYLNNIGQNFNLYLESTKPSEDEQSLYTHSQNSVLTKEIGKLSDGERTINLIQTSLESQKTSNENGEMVSKTIYFEFKENGITLATVTFDGENAIWLKAGLDASTKLILCTAILSIFI